MTLSASPEVMEIDMEPLHRSNSPVNSVAPMPSIHAPAMVVFPRRRHPVVVYLSRLKGEGQRGPGWFSPSWDAVLSCIFSVVALIILAVIQAFGFESYDLGLEALIPSMGSTCTQVLYLLTTPGAQPRAVLGAHFTGAFLGLSWAHIFKSLFSPLGGQLACAIGVALLTVLMMVTGAIHAPASATTCVAALHQYGQMHDKGFMFLVTPALLGPSVIVFLGWVLTNAVPWRHCYPLWL